ncbi:hypothetical protein [Enterobacter roggenkampii]|uniref:hypothetical protein n=1 Tax=Enterobacter roggenkampii TaxID=1812935 RepID=UPI002DC02EF1|nr:hypothetical protein [Enterobacter roggenkampii]MEB6622872.1 hypothetical protein [Enterobacter roggenkampii]
MRITVLDDDPGRRINPAQERYAIYLDAVEVKHVFTADDEKGEVIAAWIGPYISIHFLSLNPLLVRRRRYSRGERYPSALCGCHSL